MEAFKFDLSNNVAGDVGGLQLRQREFRRQFQPPLGRLSTIVYIKRPRSCTDRFNVRQESSNK
jgi:hypothetical protein